MGYYLGVDIGSVNAKLALIDEKGKVVQFDTEKVTSSPRAAVNSLIARLDGIQQFTGDCLGANSPLPLR